MPAHPADPRRPEAGRVRIARSRSPAGHDAGGGGGGSLNRVGPAISAARPEAGAHAEGEERVMALSAEDKMEILDLLARYSRAIDRGDAEGWAATFTEDGFFEALGTPSGGVARGPAELRDFIMRRDPAGRPVRHWAGNVVIEGDGDSATLRAYGQIIHVGEEGRVEVTGIYHDTLLRVGGEWKFSQRRFRADPP